MSELSGSLSEQRTAQILGDLFLERRTGVLRLRKNDEIEVWSFVSGDLYLPPGHRLVATYREQRDAGVPEVGFSWIELALAMFGRWQGGEYQFVAGAGEISVDLYGPLPTAALVMHAAVRGQGEFELTRMLGGEDQLLVAGSMSVEGLGTQLDPHEAFFLSRLVQPVAVRDLLRLANLEREEGLSRLCRLLSVGLIQKRESQAPPPPRRESRLLSPKLLRNFSHRIEESLREKPLSSEPEAHRAKVAGLLSRLGALTFYELLGLRVGAGAEEIHAAYTRLARVVHPSHAAHLGLEGKEAGLQLLFERATEAYLTLSDADRSRRYLQELGTEAIQIERQSGEQRQEELDEMAEQHYRRAMVYQERGDFHFAVELLQQAVRLSPRAEYLTELGRCQVRNPQWVAKAAASFERALKLDPDNADLRTELGGALAAQGLKARARDEYKKALEILPVHPEAQAGLEALKRGEKVPVAGRSKEASSAEEKEETPRKGFFARWFGG